MELENVNDNSDHVTCNKYICVLDFEANCADNMKELGMDNEVIEFPSVLWKYNENAIPLMTKIAEFQLFCKPKNTPILTPFCIELTKITQDKVDNGVTFPDALKQHEMWLRLHIPDFDNAVHRGNVIIATCGEWDMKIMAPKEYRNYNMKNVHSVYLKYMNVKTEFSEFYKCGSKIGMSGMLAHLGLTLDGTHHSGIDDCRNISKILIKLFEDGQIYEKVNVRYINFQEIIEPTKKKKHTKKY